MIRHEKQRRLQAAARAADAGRADGDLLTAAQFDRLTPTIRRDYLGQLGERALWDQAVIVGRAAGQSPITVIAQWASEGSA